MSKQLTRQEASRSIVSAFPSVFYMVMLFHACLTHLSVVRLCFSQRLPAPPADRANVLRALSSPSLHKLAQKTFHYCTCCRVGKGQARQV